jgi:hypothetical protein
MDQRQKNFSVALSPRSFENEDTKSYNKRVSPFVLKKNLNETFDKHLLQNYIANEQEKVKEFMLRNSKHQPKYMNLSGVQAKNANNMDHLLEAEQSYIFTDELRKRQESERKTEEYRHLIKKIQETAHEKTYGHLKRKLKETSKPELEQELLVSKLMQNRDSVGKIMGFPDYQASVQS